MLAFRDSIKKLYAEYSMFILPVIKYAMAIFTFISINYTMGYLEQLNSVVLLLVLAAFCAVLPWNAIPVIGIIMIILQCFGVGIEVGGCAVVLYMILLIFYFRFVPGDGLAITLTSATCGFGFPGIVPIGLGLMRGPVSALTAVCSMISWFFIKVVTDVVVPMKYTADSSILDIVRTILESMLNNKLLLVYMITFAAVVMVVSVIRSSGASWSWEIAIIIGGILQIALSLVLGKILSIEQDITALGIGTAVSVVVSFVLAFFVYNAKYREAERYQFEDDEFVYYVKAIPKNTSAGETSRVDDEDENQGN